MLCGGTGNRRLRRQVIVACRRLYDCGLTAKKRGQLTPCRGGCLELYYCNMVEWSWWDSSLIWMTN